MQDVITCGRPWVRIALTSLWGSATLFFGYQAIAGQRTFNGPATLPMIGVALLGTFALLCWLPGPALPAGAGLPCTRRGLFFLVALAETAGLFALLAVLGSRLLLVLPVIAALILILLHPRFGRREALYVLGLALVAAVAGLGHGGQSVPPIIWMAIQLPLVFLGLLAGWALLHHAGLLQVGIGRSLFLSEGTAAALKGAFWGMALALPWAFLNIAFGSGANDQWVRAWWAPLVALQPGIAEEAWGRVLLVSLLFLPLSRLGRARTALAWAAIIAGYWFAYLHVRGGNPLSAIASTLLIGTLYSLPLTYLWLRRGLESAMGFHFLIDFVRFAAALLISNR